MNEYDGEAVVEQTDNASGGASTDIDGSVQLILLLVAPAATINIIGMKTTIVRTIMIKYGQSTESKSIIINRGTLENPLQ